MSDGPRKFLERAISKNSGKSSRHGNIRVRRLTHGFRMFPDGDYFWDVPTQLWISCPRLTKTILEWSFKNAPTTDVQRRIYVFERPNSDVSLVSEPSRSCCKRGPLKNFSFAISRNSRKGSRRGNSHEWHFQLSFHVFSEGDSLRRAVEVWWTRRSTTELRCEFGVQRMWFS